LGDTGGKLLGQSRPYTNEFVQQVQNPFQARVSAIVDPLGEKRTAGTLTYDEVIKAQEKLEEEISLFTEESTVYGKLGSSQALAVSQAQTTLNPIFETWRNTFKDDLSRLPKPPDPVKPPPVPETAPSLDPVFAQKQALARADQEMKRTRSGGRRSTILGGAVNNRPEKRQPTILGGY